MPAIDTGRSVSRVGGASQLPAYRALVGPLKLFYSQFEELESFSKFGVQMDKETLSRLKRGKAIRNALIQRQYQMVDVATQIGLFLALKEGLLDDIGEDKIIQAQDLIHNILINKFPDFTKSMVKDKEKISDKMKVTLLTEFQKSFEKKGLIQPQ